MDRATTGYGPAVDTDFELSLEGARTAAAGHDLDRWVHAFLSSDGSDNPDLADELFDQKSSWYGPVELSFDHLNRLAGPPDQPTLDRLDEDDLEVVDDMEESLDEGWDPAPLIVSYRNDLDQLVVEDGNHRIEGLRRAGRTRYWSIVGFDDATQRQRFLDRHSADDAT